MLQVREVSLFTGRGAPENWGDRVICLRSKEGIKRLFQIKKKGGLLIFFKRKQNISLNIRKGLSDATRGQKLQWDLLSQCKNVQLHSRSDVDFS